ncbi:hypothetical protein TWF730_001299, partial [Orbilia blumenaviensis]
NPNSRGRVGAVVRDWSDILFGQLVSRAGIRKVDLAKRWKSNSKAGSLDAHGFEWA